MPIYEYLCSNCKLKFELIRAMSQSSEGAPCPRCGSSAQRVLSLFSRSSEGSPASEGRSACSSCTSYTCSSCSLL
ncbi:MAG: zinc ribbon domain-containing protein [Dehalococcoidia bacterium]|nr:MAG: zinc ribbon domain-containing protein [Dehalococcoidia bacterium]